MRAAWSDISRVTRTRQQSRSAYDALSRWYGLLIDPFERRCRQAGLAKLAAQPGERVLEIGSGTGKALISLARAAGPEGLVVGADLSPAMCRVARDALAAERVLPWAAVVCADATALPLRDGAFDAVFSSFTLELFDTLEIPRFLGECRRVLRPGGRIGVVALSRAPGPSPMLRLYEWAHRRFPSVVDCRPIYAARSLGACGFEAADAAIERLFGLPVEVVLARRGA